MSVLLFARYTTLQVLCFELASMGVPINHTWPRDQLERIVSVFLGCTIQCAFVRRWLVPVLIEALHMHSNMVWLYRALIHMMCIYYKSNLN